MANVLADGYRNNMLGDNTYTNVQLDSDTITAMFIDTGTQTPAPANTYLLQACAAGVGRIPALASAPAITGKQIGTVAVGVFSATVNTVFTALTGLSAERLIVFKNTGTDSTSPLLAIYDTVASGALSLTPNGGDVTVVWSASGLWSI